MLSVVSESYAQFESFTGADGPLDLTGTPPDTVVGFSRDSFADADGDGILQFTTVVVPTGVTLLFPLELAGSNAIVWHVTGAVVIDGTLDLRGGDGSISELPSFNNAGPGGFGGGTRRQCPVRFAGWIRARRRGGRWCGCGPCEPRISPQLWRQRSNLWQRFPVAAIRRLWRRRRRR